jgi:hypothetical protein
MKNKTLKLSTNTQWVGKPEKALDAEGKPLLDKHNKPIFLFKDKKVYIGFNWENIEVTYEELFAIITKLGFPIAPALTKDADGHKTGAKFLSHSIALVDIDSGMTIEELLQDDFYNDFGSGYYTTPSHTEDAHRFRIIFVLETDITSSNDMCLLYRWLINHYTKSDGSCKDATRLFYGTINAARSEITDRYLPEEFVKRAIAHQAEKEEKDKIKTKTSGVYEDNTASHQDNVTTYPQMSPEKQAKIVELLLTVPALGHGSHNTFLAIGWGMQAAGYSLYDFIRITKHLFSHKEELCESIWSSKPRLGGSLGAVINLIKKYHGEYCLQGY